MTTKKAKCIIASRGLVLLLCGLVCVPCLAQTPVDDSIGLSANTTVTWVEGRVRCFLLNGDVRITQGDKALTADRAVIWIEEKTIQDVPVQSLQIYAESNISFTERGTQTKLESLLVEWDTREAPDFRGQVTPLPVAPADATYERAKEARIQDLATADKKDILLDKPAGPRLVQPEKPVRKVTKKPRSVSGAEMPDLVEAEQAQRWPTSDGVTVTVLTGGVHIVQSGSELYADGVVMWTRTVPDPEREGETIEESDAYAEGSVVLYQQDDKILGDRLYVDFTNNRALVVDGSLRTFSQERNAPIVVGGKEILRLSEMRFVVRNAFVTSCDYGYPHYRLAGQKMVMYRDFSKKEKSDIVTSNNSFIMMGNIPFFYWPYFTWDVRRKGIPLKRFGMGDSSEFGRFVSTQWDLYGFGFYKNEWSDATLNVDYYSERGVGLGLDFKYERENMEGFFTSYYISDRGPNDVRDRKDLGSASVMSRLEDELGDNFLSRRDRGRIRLAHRQYLPHGWQADVELSHLSDEGVLNDFFERELKEGKAQETIGYLKKLKDNIGLTALTKVRLNNFQTQTEYLPQLGLNMIGQPIAGGRLNFFSDTEFANVRFRRRDDWKEPSPRIFRADTRNEISMPFNMPGIPSLKLDPFYGAGYSYFEDSLEGDGSVDRLATTVGMRASTQFSRTYEAESEFLNVHKLRHVVHPDVDFIKIYDVTRGPEQLVQFDGVDTVDTLDVWRFGLRNILQTKRGKPGKRYNVNWMTFDTEVNLFPHSKRDNKGQRFSAWEFDYGWQISNRVRFIADAEYDGETDDVEILNVGFNFNRSPKMNLFVGNRYIDDIDSSAFTLNLDYRFNSKWSLSLFQQYDFGLKEYLTQRVTLRRDLHRWMLEVSAERDEGEMVGGGDTRIFFMLSPKDLPGGFGFRGEMPRESVAKLRGRDVEEVR